MNTLIQVFLSAMQHTINSRLHIDFEAGNRRLKAGFFLFCCRFYFFFFYFGTFCKSSGLQFMSKNDFRYEAATLTDTHTFCII